MIHKNCFNCSEKYQSSKIDDNDNDISIKNLSQLRICAQKTINEEDRQTVENINKQSAMNPSYGSNLRAAFIQSKLWPSKMKITYAFYPVGNTPPKFTPKDFYDKKKLVVDPIQEQIYNLSPPQAVELVIKERIQPLVDLKFEKIDNINNAMLRIDFNPTKGAWSYLGTDNLKEPKSKPTMNFGWIDAMTIMHEFGHALGMIHEHQNPRGTPIPWNKPVVYEWAKKTQGWDKNLTDNNIINGYDVSTLNGSNYDPLSIMLYFFAPEMTLDKKGTTINPRLSGYDVKWITDLYKENPVTNAENFYKDTYNITLSDAISLSNNYGKSDSSGSSKGSTSDDKTSSDGPPTKSGTTSGGTGGIGSSSNKSSDSFDLKISTTKIIWSFTVIISVLFIILFFLILLSLLKKK